MDLNPANVILRDGRVVVMDLGLVFPLGDTIPEGYPRGTQGYIAPEQWHGAPCSAAMDLFSTGCILYELLAGDAPYDFAGPPLTALPPLRRPRRQPRVRRALDELISQLTNPDPGRRLGSAEAALRALGRVRCAEDRLWPPYVDVLLTAPAPGQPAWTNLTRASFTEPTTA